jgi:hypothetical protein
VDLFATYLTKYKVSENNLGANRQTSDIMLQDILLSWLIPSKADSCSSEDFVPAPVHLNAQRLAEVAVALTLRNSQWGIFPRDQTREPVIFNDIEQLYLLSTFDSNAAMCSYVVDTECGKQSLVRSSILCNVKEKLLQKVSEDLDYAIQLASPEVSRLTLHT